MVASRHADLVFAGRVGALTVHFMKLFPAIVTLHLLGGLVLLALLRAPVGGMRSAPCRRCQAKSLSIGLWWWVLRAFAALWMQSPWWLGKYHHAVLACTDSVLPAIAVAAMDFSQGFHLWRLPLGSGEVAAISAFRP
jgi:cytochrome c oxidase assembly protein subunit 15